MVHHEGARGTHWSRGDARALISCLGKDREKKPTPLLLGKSMSFLVCYITVELHFEMRVMQKWNLFFFFCIPPARVLVEERP